MKRVKSRFTLIEMLAVVAIASILIALITPAVQNLMFGSRVDQCASNFKLGLEQAQSKAIAARRYVALVLPYNHSETASSKQYQNYCRSGYRMAYVTRNGEDYNFDRWVENLDWKNPNAGALCMDVTTDSPDGNAANRLNWANDVKSRMKDLQQDKGFNVLSDLKNITNEELMHLTNDGGNGKYCAVIFSPYGGIVNNERPLYFTFTEAKAGSGGKYELDNVDNFLVLKLNAITGQVTYFDPYDDKDDE